GARGRRARRSPAPRTGRTRSPRPATARRRAAPPGGGAGSLGVHVGVAVVLRRHERLLDGARRGPAQQVDRGPVLVVVAAGPAAAERLLADDRTGRLVVDVEVAGREAQLLAGPRDGAAVLGDDRSGQCVG